MDNQQPAGLADAELSLEPVVYYNDAAGASFTLDGPMAREYAEALNEVYKKEIGPDGMTLESISLTDGYQTSMAWKNYNWLRAARGGMTKLPPYYDLGCVYACGRSYFGLPQFNELIKAFGQMSAGQRLASAVILDSDCAANEAPLLPQVVTEALVDLVSRYCAKDAPRIPVYPSLSAFIKARR